MSLEKGPPILVILYLSCITTILKLYRQGKENNELLGMSPNYEIVKLVKI